MNTAERLTRLARQQTLKLTHVGRKSGKAYQVTIWFVVEGSRVLLMTANVDRQWVRNVEQTPAVTLTVGAETFPGTVRRLADASEVDVVLAAVRRKYWMFYPFIVLLKSLMGWQIGAFEVALQAASNPTTLS
jgi:deazaflavin-dependent oxidoreductase (nitroreductase family)